MGKSLIFPSANTDFGRHDGRNPRAGLRHGHAEIPTMATAARGWRSEPFLHIVVRKGDMICRLVSRTTTVPLPLCFEIPRRSTCS